MNSDSAMLASFTEAMLEWHEAEKKVMRIDVAIVASFLLFLFLAIPFDWLTVTGALPAAACIRLRILAGRELVKARKAYWTKGRVRVWERYGVRI